MDNTAYNQFMVRILFSLIILLWFTATPLAAKPLVADLSEYNVNIDSTFTGKNLMLFGAKNDSGNVVISIRGPKRNVTVRRKKEFMGLWVNGKSVTFNNVPYYYSINGQSPLDNHFQSALYQTMEIGKPRLTAENTDLTPTEVTEFEEAFFEIQKRKGLFRYFSDPMIYMGDTLFKSLVTFPDTLPRGKYAVDMLLMEDNYIRGIQTLPITVEKVGFDAFIYDLAHNNSLLYALMAIAIALVTGWSISQLFSRLV